MLYICNLLVLLLLNCIAYIINCVLWCTYANISSIRLHKSNQTLHIYMKDIRLYNKDILIKKVTIVYYYNYKSIVYIDNIYYDISNSIHNKVTPDDKLDDELDHELDDESDDEPDPEQGIYMIRNIIRSLRDKGVYIFHNIKIKINDDMSLSLSKIIIKYSHNMYTITITKGSITYTDQSICTIKNINITYIRSRKEIVVDIQLIKIKILSYEINIKTCIRDIMSVFSIQNEQSEYTFQIFIQNIHVNFFNKHALQLYIHTLKYNSSNQTLFINDCKLKSGKKFIANVINIDCILTKKYNIHIKTIHIHVYKTTAYKLKLCLDSIIPKHKSKYIHVRKSKQENPSTYLFEASTVITQYIQDFYINTIEQSNNSKNESHTHSNVQSSEYTIIEQQSILKQIYINTLCINIKYNPNIYIICKQIQYKRFHKNIYNILIQSVCVKDMYDTCYIKTQYNKNNRIHILFKDHFLNVYITPLYVNIDTDIFKGLLDIIDSNSNDIKKLLYYDYIKNNYREYFINHLFIHSIILNVTYKPKHKSIYNNVFKSKSSYSIFNIINYKNVNLYTKEIDIYYPLNNTDLLKKIIKIWLQDIYKHQVKNIVKGVKYTKNIPSTVDFSSKLINNIKIALQSSLQYLEYS